MVLFWVLDFKVWELFRISDFGFSASDLSILISNFKFLWLGFGLQEWNSDRLGATPWLQRKRCVPDVTGERTCRNAGFSLSTLRSKSPA